MWAFASFFRRTRPEAALHVKSGDAFAACAEKLGITPREAEIVRLILEGKSGKRITEELFISDHTVKNHLHHVYQKLGIRNRIQLVRCFQSALEDPGRVAESRPAFLRRAAFPAAALLLVLAAAPRRLEALGPAPAAGGLPPDSGAGRPGLREPLVRPRARQVGDRPAPAPGHGPGPVQAHPDDQRRRRLRRPEEVRPDRPAAVIPGRSFAAWPGK